MYRVLHSIYTFADHKLYYLICIVFTCVLNGRLELLKIISYSIM